MKIYDFPGAPNPGKLKAYLAEKGLDIPLEPVDALNGANRTPEFRKINPLGGLPVLELDDGGHLTESLAIIEYLEELHPEPPMLGSSPLERARIRELERIVEIGVLNNVARYFQNTSPFFAKRIKQNSDVAEIGKQMLQRNLEVVDQKIGENEFVCGGRPTIADCTLCASLRFASFAGLELDPGFANLSRWWTTFRERPSAKV